MAAVKKKRVKNPRVPRTHASNTWTKAQYFSFIRSTLRRAFTRYPVKFKVLAAAARAVTGQRHKTEYQCAVCEEWFKQSEVEVDHYPHACGSLKEYTDLPQFVERLFCEETNLRVICKPCHKEHTYGDKE
jgi:hypothetical protein